MRYTTFQEYKTFLSKSESSYGSINGKEQRIAYDYLEEVDSKSDYCRSCSGGR